MASVSVDENKRRIYLIGEIDDSATNEFISALHVLQEAEGDISIIIDSEGGNEIQGYAIYDVIMMCPNMVYIEVYGQASSICSAIVQAADVRRMAPNAILMMHNGTIPMGEEVKQTMVIDTAAQIKRDSAKYYAILASRSRLTQSEISDLCKMDSYFSAEEALEAGLCDEILVPIKKHTKPKKRKKK